MALGLLDRARLAIARKIAPRPSAGEVSPDRPPGRFTLGTGWFGGPDQIDPFGAQRAPSPLRLVENYKALIYSMVQRNKNGVTRIPLRLYADGSRVQGKPSRAADPVKVARSNALRFVQTGQVSPAAVDQVFEIRNHPILDVLDHPDPHGFFCRKSLIGLLVTQMDVIGAGFLVPGGNGWDWEAGAIGRTAPEFLWPVYSQYMLPIRYAGDPQPYTWQYFADRIPVDNAFWFRQAISLRDPYGSSYSPTYAGAMYTEQEQLMVAIAAQMLGLGPRPNLAVTAADAMMPPGEAERKRYEQDLNRRQSGPNAGGVVVSTGAWKFDPINQPPADNSWRELSEYDRDVLATIFGQPPTYYTVDSNLANLQAADEQHARNGLEPRCHAIAEVFTNLVRKWDRRLFFEFDPAIQEDSESKEKVITMRLTSGRTTINQENEEDRWPPVEWGDEPWLPGTLKQPSMMKAEHEQALEQREAAIKQGEESMKNEKKMTEFQTSDEPSPLGDRDEKKRALWERIERLRDEMREAG